MSASAWFTASKRTINHGMDACIAFRNSLALLCVWPLVERPFFRLAPPQGTFRNFEKYSLNCCFVTIN